MRGLLFTVQKALPLISDGGAIVMISSIAAFKGIPNYTSYSATKAAVRSFVRTWTAELKDRGIRLDAISPGAVDTPIIDAQSVTNEGADTIRASFKAATPISRLGRPEEIAAAALFLASDEGSYVAGAENASSTLLNQSRSAKPARIVTLSPSPADFRIPTSARSNLHSARQPSHSTSRAFLHWRLSDDGRGASRIVPVGRRPKPFTIGDIPGLAWYACCKDDCEGRDSRLLLNGEPST